MLNARHFAEDEALVNIATIACQWFTNGAGNATSSAAGTCESRVWEHAGKDANKLPAVMEVGELVDTALAGFDRGETVTIPPLPDATQWTDFEAARKVMIPISPGARCGALSPLCGVTSRDQNAAIKRC